MVEVRWLRITGGAHRGPSKPLFPIASQASSVFVAVRSTFSRRLEKEERWSCIAVLCESLLLC